ncbi:MAG: hypothetical protein GY869_24395, partial [Planctomycetes bacterium]|nr:hypothetical protein [Planctomycetota bacterium]
GFQLTPFVNTGGNAYGFSIAGIYNNHSTQKGFSLALINLTNELHGFSIGPLASVVFDDAYGALISGLITFTDNMSGFAIGPITNINIGDMKGVQVGLVNFADYARGVQIGVVNYARKLAGVQIGPFNGNRDGGLPFMVGLNIGFYRKP